MLRAPSLVLLFLILGRDNAKAIRDGVIDATIDHENKILQSKV